MRSAKYVYYAIFSMVLLGIVQQTLEGPRRGRYITPQRESLKRQSLPPKLRDKLQRRIKEQRERIEKERRKVFLEELYNKLADSEEQREEQYQKQQLLKQQLFMQQKNWKEQLQEANEQLYERLSEKNYQEALQSVVIKQEKIREELKLPIISTDFCAQLFGKNIVYQRGS